MSIYTKFKRGSEWRIWDLHIHTPETQKNDNYTGSTTEEKWNNYINTINKSEKNIAVIGITDYVSIDNYFKFKEYVNTGKITKKFDLILPNIELRMAPVTASSKPINIHCLFNPSIDKEIEDRFLSKLGFSYSNSQFSATKSELIRLGRKYTNNDNLDDFTAHREGAQQYVISFDTLKVVFEKDIDLRHNTLIVVSNSHRDGVSGIIRHSDFFIDDISQLDALRRSIYQFSDGIFSSNSADRSYFSGNGADSKAVVLDKCATLKPCFHGCDAHENGKVFNPDDSKFCWIKSDPTFEGLRQTLFEPEDRIQIQSTKPDTKKERYVIDQIQFRSGDGFFGDQKILFNENLNAIIGGKSSGKSLLLYSIAKSIDPDQVTTTSKRLGFDGYKFDESYDFETKWKNGDIDTLSDSRQENKFRKITYIPQLYINYLAEKNNKEELNKLIENILLQDAKFKEYYEERKVRLDKISTDIDSHLIDFYKARSKALETKGKIKEIGSSISINKEIQSIIDQIEECHKHTNLDQVEIDSYNALLKDRENLEKVQNEIFDKEVITIKILNELNAVKNNLFAEASSNHRKGAITRILDSYVNIPNDIIDLVESVNIKLSNLIQETQDEVLSLNIYSDKEIVKTEINSCNEKIEPYKIKLTGQEEIAILNERLLTERGRLNASIQYEKQITSFTDEYVTIKKKISILLHQRISLYKEINLYINSYKSIISEGISLKCNIIFRQDKFLFFEQVNKGSISRNHFIYDYFENNLVKYEKLPDLFLTSRRVIDEKLQMSDNTDIPLKKRIEFEDVINGLVKDCFEYDFTVTYKDDDLLNMSPGKKGTVLLILFLEISSSEFPILIDQPEDNLDNRTIYDLLCKMIKEKKRERQIIIVSHNANLVVATDAENIIVANQEGQDPKKSKDKFRFEYVNGALEDSRKRNESLNGILFQQGTKEHVCDVLEGGGEAFKQREKKYSII